MKEISPLSKLIFKYTERDTISKTYLTDGKLDKIGFKVPSSPESPRFLQLYTS